MIVGLQRCLHIDTRDDCGGAEMDFCTIDAGYVYLYDENVGCVDKLYVTIVLFISCDALGILCVHARVRFT